MCPYATFLAYEFALCIAYSSNNSYTFKSRITLVSVKTGLETVRATTSTAHKHCFE